LAIGRNSIIISGIVLAFIAGAITANPVVEAAGGWKAAFDDLINGITAVDLNPASTIGGSLISTALSCANQLAIHSVSSQFLVSSECITLDGTLAFATSAGGTGSDRGSGITTLSDNSVVVTGQYSGTATFETVTLTSVGGSDIFVAKYS